MATAQEVISISLRYLGKETPNKQASDADYTLMLRKLNNLLDRWFKLGLRASVNTTPIPSLASVVPFPDVGLDALEKNLAVDGWRLFNLSAPISIDLANEAKDAKTELWNMARPIPKTVFPSTLATGSGNDNGTGWDRTFYPDCDELIYPCDDSQLLSQSGVPLKGVNND